MASQRRTNEEWQQLLAEFESGNISGTDFCRERGISTSNFYKRRTSRLGDQPSAFVTARRAAPLACSVSVQIGEVMIRCDTRTPVTWVSDLVVALRG